MSRKLVQTLRIPLPQGGRHHANIIRRARKAIDKILPLRLFADGASALPGLPQLRGMIEGPTHHFAIVVGGDTSGHDVEMALGAKGITVWNKLAVPSREEGTNKIGLDVREAQAEWAQYLLKELGAQIIQGELPESSRNTPRTERGTEGHYLPLQTTGHPGYRSGYTPERATPLPSRAEAGVPLYRDSLGIPARRQRRQADELL